MTILAGVDGCSTGWVVATQNIDTGQLDCLVVDSISSFLATGRIPAVLAIDAADRSARDRPESV